jgi:hypothetical protein
LLVYRDGLISIVVFTFVNMMPLTLIVLLHLLRPKPGPHSRRVAGRRGPSKAPPGSPSPLPPIAARILPRPEDPPVDSPAFVGAGGTNRQDSS